MPISCTVWWTTWGVLLIVGTVGALLAQQASYCWLVLIRNYSAHMAINYSVIISGKAWFGCLTHAAVSCVTGPVRRPSVSWKQPHATAPKNAHKSAKHQPFFTPLSPGFFGQFWADFNAAFAGDIGKNYRIFFAGVLSVSESRAETSYRRLTHLKYQWYSICLLMKTVHEGLIIT